MAEMALEDANMKDLDDDNDFVDDKGMLSKARFSSKYLTVQAHHPSVEEDVFGSDFESTDEEAEKQANEAGENEVLHDERMVKRVSVVLNLHIVANANMCRQHELDLKRSLPLLTPKIGRHLILISK